MAILKCPECGQTLRRDRTEVTHDTKRNTYDATMYKCKYDGVWVTVEVPREEKTK